MFSRHCLSCNMSSSHSDMKRIINSRWQVTGSNTDSVETTGTRNYLSVALVWSQFTTVDLRMHCSGLSLYFVYLLCVCVCVCLWSAGA